MYKTERQRELMNILKEEKNGGFVSIHRLARQMFASEATIRRDLRELEAQNAIKRAYGGVALMEYLNQNIPLPLREQTHHPEKVEAARRAASVVRDGDVLFLDGASTTLEMIPFLAERKEKKRQKQIEKNLRQGQLAHEKAVKRHAEREAAEAKKAAAEKDTNPCQAETV